jgi:hypothetical protein
VYGISTEEFFMYLTNGLVIVIPISARIYRRLQIGRLKAQLKEKDGPS